MAPLEEEELRSEDDSKMRTKYGFIDRYHYERRRDILKAHPEIRHLMRNDPSFKYVAICCAVTQALIAYLLRNSDIGFILLMALVAGSLFCSAIANSTHELVHDQAFLDQPLLNKIWGTAVNCAMGWPGFGGYYRTHRNHHSFLGTNLDAKYPSIEEAYNHPTLGGERWGTYVNEPASELAIWNFRVVWAFNVLFVLLTSWRSYLYIFLSFWLNDCVYVQGSKNFADHWCDDEKPYARSYYGWMNMINHNVGHHREHHDFPNVPGRYLPHVTQLATEFYRDPVNIANSLFEDVWNVLIAPPGEGLLKHANKLSVSQAALKKNN